MRAARGSYLPLVTGVTATLRASCNVLAHQAIGRLDTDVLERASSVWRQRILRAGDVKLEVSGRENVLPGRSYVVMFNHRSHVDIPVLLEAFPLPLRGVSKAELGRVPVWGHAMRAAGFVFVDRSDRARAIAQLEGAKPLLREGISMFVAPEGTRSRDGTLLPFKKGGFHVARDIGVPIIPVWIEGTAEVMRPNALAIHKGRRVRVGLGEPIASDGSIDALMVQVRTAMEVLAGQGAATAPLSPAGS